MNPRNAIAVWQHVAHRAKCGHSGFAIVRALGNSAVAPAVLQTCSDSGQDCYPFPSPWSGPTRVGPFYTAPKDEIERSCAICVMCHIFWFVFSGLAVESPSITTNNRGRKLSCAIPLSYWLSFRCHLLAVCRIRHLAALLALRRVQHLPILPITTRLPVRLLADWLVLRRAALTSVCRPAIDLIRRIAFAPTMLNQRSSGVSPWMAAFLHSADSVLPPGAGWIYIEAEIAASCVRFTAFSDTKCFHDNPSRFYRSFADV